MLILNSNKSTGTLSRQLTGQTNNLMMIKRKMCAYVDLNFLREIERIYYHKHTHIE